MRRVALVLRLFAALTLAFWLAGATSISTFAQDGEATPAVTETPPDEEAPPVEEQTLQGTLTILVFACGDGPEGEAGNLFLEGEFTPSEQCAEAGTAAISIDGGAAEQVASGTQYTLDEGTYSVLEETLGASVSVEVAEAAPATIYAVFYVAPEPAAIVPGAIAIVTHLCGPDIQSVDDFNALGDNSQKLLACPAITLSGDTGPDGSINGNNPETPLSFDYSVAAAGATLGIGDAGFTPDEMCEADLGDLNGDDTDNLCLDVSSYRFPEVAQGPVTITEVTPPDGYEFGAVEFTPESGDDATLVETNQDESRIELDTTGDESVTLHVYNFQKPVENRVSIVNHQCGSSMDAAAFNALGGYLEKIAACPAVLRGGDTGPAGAVNGGKRTFAFDVEGSDGALQTLENNATFVPAQVCEDEIGDINGDGGDNVCLDLSRYQLDGVQQGPGVLVTQTKFSKGYEYGGVEFDPETDDAAALVSANDGVIELDTTLDGDVTLHVFSVKADEPAPSPTPTNTPEPTTTGTVLVVKLFCYGPAEETVITALAPGESASAGQMGDSSCVAGNADFFISLFGTDSQPAFFVGDDGIEAIELPVTDSGTGPHTLTEIYSSETGEFEIAPGETTRVIVLNYVLEETVDPPPDDDEAVVGEDDEVLDGDGEALGDAVASDVNDEETILSGEDLAETGMGPLLGSPSNGPMILFGAAGILLLVGAAGLRRRSA